MLLSNDRSLPHRKVANFYAQLRVKELENERLQIFTAVTGEAAVSHRIGQLEVSVLHSQPDRDATTASWDALSNQHINNIDNLRDFCLRMQMSYNQVQGLIQERALDVLRHRMATHPETKSALVNYGALVAAIQAMRNFPNRPRVQRDATALILNLVFVDESTDIIDTEGNTVSTAESTTLNEGLDMGILRLIQDQGGLECLRQAVRLNRYEVSFFDAGEIKNFARRLAASQIPGVLERVQSLLFHRHPADVALLQRKMRFLRSSFASLLDDATMVPTSLISSSVPAVI